MNSIETEETLITLLKGSDELVATLNGGIYPRERPDGSTSEDIVVSNISLNHDMPQGGTSNINIHVPDEKVSINKKQQYKYNKERIKELTTIVLAVLKTANITGLTVSIDNETIIKEAEINQHYNNIRINWNIQITN